MGESFARFRAFLPKLYFIQPAVTRGECPFFRDPLPRLKKNPGDERFEGLQD